MGFVFDGVPDAAPLELQDDLIAQTEALLARMWSYKQFTSLQELIVAAAPAYVRDTIICADRAIAAEREASAALYRSIPSSGSYYSTAAESASARRAMDLHTLKMDAQTAAVLMAAGFTGDVNEDAMYLRTRLLHGDRQTTYSVYALAQLCFTPYTYREYLRAVIEAGDRSGVLRHDRSDRWLHVAPTVRVPRPDVLAKRNKKRDETRDARARAREAARRADRVNRALSLALREVFCDVDPGKTIRFLSSPSRVKEALKQAEARALEDCGGDKDAAKTVKKEFADARKAGRTKKEAAQ